MSLKLGNDRHPDQPDVEALYRAVADGEPTFEILQMIYDMHGERCNLRPPVAELRLANSCGVRSVSRG